MRGEELPATFWARLRLIEGFLSPNFILTACLGTRDLHGCHMKGNRILGNVSRLKYLEVQRIVFLDLGFSIWNT